MTFFFFPEIHYPRIFLNSLPEKFQETWEKLVKQ